MGLKDELKLFGKALLVSGFITLVAFVACGCDLYVEKTDPASVVENAIRAVPSRDTQKVTKYFSGQAVDIMRLKLEGLYATYNEVEVEELIVKEISREGENAVRVSARFYICVSMLGNDNRQFVDYIARVYRVGDKWLIANPF